VVVVADSSFSALELIAAARRYVCLITRLRLDATLFEPAPKRRRGQIGRPAMMHFTDLGRVDGFHPHQNACETDNGAVAGRGLLASHGDALEPLQFAHRLFDPGARPV
jgi:hypothetical protein